MSEPEQRIRIAIVDDHEMFRAGVIATLQPHFDVVGQAADVEGSVAMIAQTKPLLPRYRVFGIISLRFATGCRFRNPCWGARLCDQNDFR